MPACPSNELSWLAREHALSAARRLRCMARRELHALKLSLAMWNFTRTHKKGLASHQLGAVLLWLRVCDCSLSVKLTQLQYTSLRTS